MEKIILEDYEITQKTMALLSAAHLDYWTIVLEPDQQLYIHKKPLQLIKTACLKGGSTYEGRRTAVHYLTQSKNKVPIPINPLEHFYAFPTHSPNQFHCNWIFYHHVKSMTPCKKSNETIITFKNSQELTLPVSHYTLEKQLYRTATCMLRFSNQLPLPFQF
jgi:competence protein ComK